MKIRIALLGLIFFLISLTGSCRIDRAVTVAVETRNCVDLDTMTVNDTLQVDVKVHEDCIP